MRRSGSLRSNQFRLFAGAVDAISAVAVGRVEARRGGHAVADAAAEGVTIAAGHAVARGHALAIHAPEAVGAAARAAALDDRRGVRFTEATSAALVRAAFSGLLAGPITGALLADVAGAALAIKGTGILSHRAGAAAMGRALLTRGARVIRSASEEALAVDTGPSEPAIGVRQARIIRVLRKGGVGCLPIDRGCGVAARRAVSGIRGGVSGIGRVVARRDVPSAACVAAGRVTGDRAAMGARHAGAF